MMLIVRRKQRTTQHCLHQQDTYRSPPSANAHGGEFTDLPSPTHVQGSISASYFDPETRQLRTRNCARGNADNGRVKSIWRSPLSLSLGQRNFHSSYTHKAWCSETLVWHRLGIAFLDAWGLRCALLLKILLRASKPPPLSGLGNFGTAPPPKITLPQHASTDYTSYLLSYQLSCFRGASSRILQAPGVCASWFTSTQIWSSEAPESPAYICCGICFSCSNRCRRTAPDIRVGGVPCWLSVYLSALVPSCIICLAGL